MNCQTTRVYLKMFLAKPNQNAPKPDKFNMKCWSGGGGLGIISVFNTDGIVRLNETIIGSILNLTLFQTRMTSFEQKRRLSEWQLSVAYIAYRKDEMKVIGDSDCHPD